MKKALGIISIAILAVAIIAVIVVISLFTSEKNYDMSPRMVSGHDSVNKIIEGFYEQSRAVTRTSSNDSPIDIASLGTLHTYDISLLSQETTAENCTAIVENDRIFKLNANGCAIVKTDNGGLMLESEINIENYVPFELFLSGEKLVMVGGISDTAVTEGVVIPEGEPHNYYKTVKTDIRIYDVADTASPMLDRKIVIDGSFNRAWLNEQTGRLMFLSDYNFYYGQEKSYIPKISDSLDGEQERSFPHSDIFYFEDISCFSYLIMGAISIKNVKDSSIKAYLGLSGNIHVSEKNIFVATYDQASVYKRNVFGWAQYGAKPSTRLIRVSQDDFVTKAAIRVEGEVRDRYALDEYDGYLRVATTTNGKSRYNNIFVLDADSLSTVGSLTNVAKDYAICSIRFFEEAGTLITLRPNDPVYSIDLNDPASPKIQNIAVTSTTASGSNHEIGERFTVEISKMYSSGRGGISISLYDNALDDITCVDTYVIEGECYSEIFYESNALVYIEETDCFAFSYENWRENESSQGGLEQGLAVFRLEKESGEDSARLVHCATLSNILRGKFKAKETANYYDTYYSYINGATVIDGYLYTISDRYIVSYNINDRFRRVELLEICERAEDIDGQGSSILSPDISVYIG